MSRTTTVRYRCDQCGVESPMPLDQLLPDDWYEVYLYRKCATARNSTTYQLCSHECLVAAAQEFAPESK